MRLRPPGASPGTARSAADHRCCPLRGRGRAGGPLGGVVMILDLHRQGCRSRRSPGARLDRKTVRKDIAGGLEAAGLRSAPAAPDAATRSRRICASGLPPAPELTGRRLHREIRERGYCGGYTAVTDLLRDVRPPAARRCFEVRFETGRRTGAGRLRAFPDRVHRRAGRDPDRLAVLAGARPQPDDVGPLRAAPGHADPAALPYRGLRGAGRRAAPDPL